MRSVVRRRAGAEDWQGAAAGGQDAADRHQRRGRGRPPPAARRARACGRPLLRQPRQGHQEGGPGDGADEHRASGSGGCQVTKDDEKDT